MDNNNPGTGASYEEIAERTGIMEGSEMQIDDAPVEGAEVKAEAKPEAKAEEAKPEARTEAKTEAKGEEDPKSESPTKRESRPLKAVFTQIKELRNELRSEIAALKTATPTQATAVEKSVSNVLDDAVKEIADKRNLDADGLKDVLALAEKAIMKKLEDSGLLKKDLPPELQEKLKILDTIEQKQKAEEERLHDREEWLSFVPELQKQFPNASANEISEAQKLMDELSHTKEFHDKELDYVLYKNRDKFATILSVAKAKKSAEAQARDVSPEDTGEEEDIDLDPENIDPVKMARYQKKKYSQRDDGIIKIS